MYKVKYKIFPKDLFKIQMFSIYRSLVGVVNIVFCIAMITLFIFLYNKVNIAVLFLVALLALYFPIIHPILVYLSCIRKAEDVNDGKILYFENDKWKIKYKDESEKEFPYSKIKLAVSQFNLALLYLDNKEAYIINPCIIESTYQCESCVDILKSEVTQDFIDFINKKI